MPATACAPPSTWITSPLIASNQSESRKRTARATGDGSSVSQPSGAAAGQLGASWWKPAVSPPPGGGLVEPVDPPRRGRGDRAGRDQVGADAAWTQFPRQIAVDRLQRGLRHA